MRRTFKFCCGSSHSRSLNFDRIICGSPAALERALHAEEGRQQVFTRWQQLSPGAALPLPAAVLSAVRLVREQQPKEAVALLSCHPQRREVMQQLTEYIRGHPQDFTLPALREVVEVARSSQLLPVVELLALMAQFAVSSSTATEEQREEVRRLLLREITFNVHSTPKLFQPLCRLSRPVPEHVEGVVSALEAVKHGIIISPGEFRHALQLFAASGRPDLVESTWLWARETSACWDPVVISAVMLCYCKDDKLAEVVECVQYLTAVGRRPTMEAQEALFRLLGERQPAELSYMNQLVELWYGGGKLRSPGKEKEREEEEEDGNGKGSSTAPQLWSSAHCKLGFNIIDLMLKNGQRRTVVDMLEEYYLLQLTEDERAGKKKRDKPEEEDNIISKKQFILSVPPRALLCLFNEQYLQKDLTRDLCFINTLQLGGQELAAHPQLLAVLLLYAYRQDEDLHRTLQSTRLSSEAFGDVCKFVAEEGFWLSSKEKLSLLQRYAAVLGAKLPEEVQAWLELLKSMNK